MQSGRINGIIYDIETIENIKQKIQEKGGIPPDQQRQTTQGDSASGEVENGVSLTLYFDALDDSPWFFKAFALDALPEEILEE